MDVDWPALRRAALEAMGCAYAPYSHFPVGAAALVDAATARPSDKVFLGIRPEHTSLADAPPSTAR